jgi:hypothetical protein
LCSVTQVEFRAEHVAGVKDMTQGAGVKVFTVRSAAAPLVLALVCLRILLALRECHIAAVIRRVHVIPSSMNITLGAAARALEYTGVEVE